MPSAVAIAGVKAVVTDIEGTTSSISFVHDVLFPYARAEIPDFVRAHEATLGWLFEEVRKLEGRPDLGRGDVIAALLRWIDEDRKATPLKTLQGMVWKAGFESGAFKGHVYDDAADALIGWHSRGLPLYIYSSGSIAAQKLLFGHSERGDLTPLLSGYFDTTTGPKLEAGSYVKIAGALGLNPAQILFLSDHEGETDAARAAGMQCVVLDGEGALEEGGPSPIARDFSQIRIEPASQAGLAAGGGS